MYFICLEVPSATSVPAPVGPISTLEIHPATGDIPQDFPSEMTLLTESALADQLGLDSRDATHQTLPPDDL